MLESTTTIRIVDIEPHSTTITNIKSTMSSKNNTRIVLQSRPKGPIEPDTFKTDRSERVPTEKDLKDGEVVVRVMWISLVSGLGL